MAGTVKTAAGSLLEPIFDLTQAGQSPLHSQWILPFERRGPKPFANDQVEGRDVMIDGALFSLRFVESKLQHLPICPSGTRAPKANMILSNTRKTTHPLF